MLLWLNGMTNPTIKHPMETMMEEYHTNPINILPLLAEDEFFIQAKNLNTKVIDFIRLHQQSITSQLLDLIVQQIDEVNQDNHDHVIVFPILAIEFFELDLPPLTQMMLQEQSIEVLFSGLPKTPDQIHEPQWSNIQRLFALLLVKEPQIIVSAFFKVSSLKLFLNHLQSATVNNILIQMFNPEFGNFEDLKLEVIQLGFKGFEIMDQMSVLNFTYLIHEIMTRYFSHDACQSLVKFIINENTIIQMFTCLKQNHDSLFLAKSSAHILSLISNYYSYTMQNINIYEEPVTKKMLDENPDIAYHQQLTNDFESSDFMKIFLQNMDLFVQSFTSILEQDHKRLRTLRLKLLEIFDNLTRISNLKLWRQMNQLKLFNQIIQIYFKYPNADIFHSIFEKLLLYILNRAISDFHPYWSLIIFQEIDLYTIVSELIVPKQSIPGHVHMLANHLLWFQKELSEKLVIDGSLAKYEKPLKQIEETILWNDKWRRVVPIINLLNQKNSVQLGAESLSSQNIPPQQEPVIIQKDEEQTSQNAQCLFNKVKNSQQNISSVSGDQPAEFESPEKDIAEQNKVEEEYQYENRKSPEKQSAGESIKDEFKVESPQNQQRNDQPQLPQSSPTPYNIAQTKGTDYKFVEDVYLQQQSPTKQQQQQKDYDSTPERDRPAKKIDMMSISLQDFVRPIEKVKYQSDSKPSQSAEQQQGSPNKKVQDIIKKYSNMSKSVTFGQAQSNAVNIIDDQQFFSLARKKSMESSLRLKQLDQVAVDEFKILKTSNNEETKILTNDNKRILMVDELDKSVENDSLRNSLVNLSNVSFSSTGGKKRTIKFKKSKQAPQVDQNNNSVNQAVTIPEEMPPTSTKSLTFSVTSSNSMRDSCNSNQSFLTQEKKFRYAKKKDKGDQFNINMLYESLQEQLQECLPEFQRQFVIQNYQKFIETSKENDPIYQQYIQIIDRFKQAGEQIDTISTDITELRDAKIRCKEQLEQHLSKEDDVVEDVQAEDQLTEMLDNLSMFTFEKNYEQALESHKLLTEALQSKKFMKLIKKPEIYRQVDSAFKSLCQSLYNDYISQNAQYDSAQLMQYLMILNQVEMLIQGYLQLQQKKFMDWIETQNQCTEKQIQQFINNIIKINQQYEQIFSKYLKKNQLLFSFISVWNQTIIHIYFTQITSFFFQDIVQFDDIFNKAKQLLNTFAQYQSKGITIDFDIQRELATYIDNKINELFSLYGQKINQFMHFNDHKLIKLEYMANLLDSDKLMESKESSNSNKPLEIKIKASATVKSTFEQLSQPLSISSCFFWNIVFRLGDSTLNFFHPEQYPLLSTLLNDSIGKMLVLFVKDYQQAMSTNKKESHQLFEIGNLFGNFNLNSTLSQYLQGRASPLPFTNNSEWKKVIQDWYEELRLLIQQYYKGAILNVLPFWICEHGKVYCQKQISVQRPSPLFLMIAFTILELKNQFLPYIPQNPSSYFLALLWDYVKYLIEYSFYWSYHNQGKNSEVFFLDRKSRDELKLDMNQINLQLSQGGIKIQQITSDGLKQLIFDVQFIFDLYSRYIGALPQNDQFLKKLVTLYCKEKKCEQQQIEAVNFEQYFTNQFQKDMLQAKTYIEQQRKSIVT